MQDDQHEQGVVQTLEALPELGLEFPQRDVAGNGEQPNHDHQRHKAGPVPQAETVQQQAAIGRDEEGEEGAHPAAAQQHQDRVNHAADHRPRPHVTAQIVRNGRPPAEQEVGWPDKERDRDEAERKVAAGEDEPRDEGAVLAAALIGHSRLAIAMTGRSGVAPAVMHYCGVAASMNHRLAPAVIHRCGVAASLIHMGIREIHEYDHDHATRNGEGRVVEKEAPPQIAASAKRLSRGRLRNRTHS